MNLWKNSSFYKISRQQSNKTLYEVCKQGQLKKKLIIPRRTTTRATTRRLTSSWPSGGRQKCEPIMTPYSGAVFHARSNCARNEILIVKLWLRKEQLLYERWSNWKWILPVDWRWTAGSFSLNGVDTQSVKLVEFITKWKRGIQLNHNWNVISLAFTQKKPLEIDVLFGLDLMLI